MSDDLADLLKPHEQPGLEFRRAPREEEPAPRAASIEELLRLATTTGVQVNIDGEWRDLGLSLDPIRLSRVDDGDRLWDAGMATFRAEMRYQLAVLDPDPLGLYYNTFLDAPPSLTVTYSRPAYGDPPRRRHGWTARRYRAERRAWGRRRRAWKRNGRPTQQHSLHLPHVTLQEQP